MDCIRKFYSWTKFEIPFTYQYTWAKTHIPCISIPYLIHGVIIAKDLMHLFYFYYFIGMCSFKSSWYNTTTWYVHIYSWFIDKLLPLQEVDSYSHQNPSQGFMVISLIINLVGLYLACTMSCLLYFGSFYFKKLQR